MDTPNFLLSSKLAQVSSIALTIACGIQVVSRLFTLF